jgi:hypothetical protein
MGHILNQDTFTVQLMNSKEELKSYARSNLREVTISTRAHAFLQRQTDAVAGRRHRQLSGFIERRYSVKTRLLVVLMCALGGTLSAQVTYDRILHADREPQNWLTYGGHRASATVRSRT